MKKAGLLPILFVVPLLAVAVITEAQQPKKVARIGFLAAVSHSANSARFEAFRQGLRELGYVEDKNIVIEWRYAEGKLDRLPALAAELVRLKVDVIVSGGSTATRPAKEATNTTPIVMAQDTDPVGSGFVASLARPGGNITGLATLAPELSGKQLELMKEIVPRLSRVAVLGSDCIPGGKQWACRRSPCADELRRYFSANTDYRSRNKESATGRIRQDGVCGRRRSHDLQREQYRLVPARRYVCGQDFERR